MRVISTPKRRWPRHPIRESDIAAPPAAGVTESGKTSRRIPRAIVRALQLGATALVTLFIFRALGVGLSDIQDLDARWWRPDWPWFGSASVVLVCAYVLSGVLWGRMVHELGGPSLGWSRATGLYMAANLGRYVPGKIWQILGLVYLSRSAGASPATASAAAVLGQALSLVGASALGLLVLVNGTSRVTGVLGLTLLVVILGGVMFLSVPRFTEWALSRWSRVLGEAPTLPQFDAGFGLRWALLYVINWTVFITAFWMFVRAFAEVGFLQAGPAFAAAYVTGYLFLPAPAGVGVREGALAGLLTPVLGPGAVAVALTARVWFTVFEVVTAVPFATRLMARRTHSGVGQ